MFYSGKIEKCCTEQLTLQRRVLSSIQAKKQDAERAETEQLTQPSGEDEPEAVGGAGCRKGQSAGYTCHGTQIARRIAHGKSWFIAVHLD